MAVSPTHNGWRWDPTNTRLDFYYRGVRQGHVNTSGVTSLQGLFAVGAITTTTGNVTATAGDLRVTAGNARLGVVSAFATTEPTSWLVCKQGTQPSGAITTSGGIGANATTVQKIVAGGTINNVET
jgi:hypothetical protein